MTTIVPPRPATKLEVTGYDGPETLTEQIKMAEMLAKARVTIPPEYRDNPSDVFAMILQAKALNIAVMTALGNLHWNPELGKGAMSAQLMGALMLRGGVSWTVVEESDKRVAMRFTRADGLVRDAECDWRIGEAVTAGIAGRDTWQHYPVDMLYARCLARGSRRYAQDIVLGMGYTPEELRDATAVDEPPTVDAPISPEVRAILDQADAHTDDPDALRALLKHAQSAKGGRCDGDHSGDGVTLAARLQAMWLAANAKRNLARTEAVDAHTVADKVISETPVPGDAAALTAPAGEGNAPCGCPNERILSGAGHLDGCSKQKIRF